MKILFEDSSWRGSGESLDDAAECKARGERGLEEIKHPLLVLLLNREARGDVDGDSVVMCGGTANPIPSRLNDRYSSLVLGLACVLLDIITGIKRKNNFKKRTNGR